MKKLALTLIIIVLAGAMAAAQSVPPLVNYQGMLADADGKPLTGTKKLEFNLYDAATEGNKVWGPQLFNSVPLVNGMFNVILGTTDTEGRSIAEAFGEKDRYLGIKVGEGAELAPRQQILSTPFAINAENANDSYFVQGYDLHELIEGLKAGKFLADGLPDADYDSGWFFVEPNNNYDKEHNLGALPRMGILWGASDSNGSDMYVMDNIFSVLGGYGSWLQRITTTTYRVSTGAGSAVSAYGKDHILNWSPANNGYVRVFMWK